MLFSPSIHVFGWLALDQTFNIGMTERWMSGQHIPIFMPYINGREWLICSSGGPQGSLIYTRFPRLHTSAGTQFFSFFFSNVLAPGVACTSLYKLAVWKVQLINIKWMRIQSILTQCWLSLVTNMVTLYPVLNWQWGLPHTSINVTHPLDHTTIARPLRMQKFSIFSCFFCAAECYTLADRKLSHVCHSPVSLVVFVDKKTAHSYFSRQWLTTFGSASEPVTTLFQTLHRSTAIQASAS